MDANISSDVSQTDTPQLRGISIVQVVFGTVFRYGIGMYQTIQITKNFSETSFSTLRRQPHSSPRSLLSRRDAIFYLIVDQLVVETFSHVR